MFSFATKKQNNELKDTELLLSFSKRFYIETYGCQMNLSDSDIIEKILYDNHYILTKNINEADVILINTCSIRNNAEQKVYKRIETLQSLKKNKNNLLIGVVGCMAEHSLENLKVYKGIDIIAGPDNYRKLPFLLKEAEKGKQVIDTKLSTRETYKDIIPNHPVKGVSAFISIMRGCNNYCSYCVVPYTRGRERSRNPKSIFKEIYSLKEKGYKEIILLGQNVNSYLWTDKNVPAINFPSLLEMVASIDKNIRVRFTTSHPKDLSEELIRTMAKHPNVCKHLHLPVQSGSNKILDLMNRKYSRENYMEKIHLAKSIIPEISITTDIISGFCTETEDDHKMTLSLMEEVRFDMAYMFMYSERTGTDAVKLADDVPTNVKKRRLNEIIDYQLKSALESNKKDIGKQFEVLTEGYSKRSMKMYKGRNSQNKMVVFEGNNIQQGQYVQVLIKDCTSATLIGDLVL